jgi:sugar phosphate isomerase/epimerase
MTTRPVGVGHLTLLDAPPPQWVSLAGQAGFEAVGIRAATASPAEEPWPLSAGSPMMAEVLKRMDDTGVRCNDVEIIRLTPETLAADYRGQLETGAALRANFVNVIAFDPDLSRSADTFAALAQEAAQYGLRPCMEGMAYSAVTSLADAVKVLSGSGGGLIIDPMHLQRCGDSPEALRALDVSLLGYLQLCDGPLELPSDLPRPEKLPRNQSADVSAAQLEARAARVLPGEGEMPLREIIDAVPRVLPTAVECPNLQLVEELGDLEFLRRARQAAARLLDAPP